MSEDTSPTTESDQSSASVPSQSNDADTSSQPTTTPAKLNRQPSLGPVHECFICLQTSEDNPNATWINACGCSLEAHEECMLHWVAETEAEAGDRKKAMRCPACKGRIHIVEPWDSFVWFRERCNRAYSRVSPLLILSIMSSMGLIGSGYYGFVSMSLFGGFARAVQWLRPSRSRLQWWQWGAPEHSLTAKVLLLNLIAPGLLLYRALPTLGNTVTFPASLVYASILLQRDEALSWPPSPSWAMTLMPWVRMAYNGAYYEVFGRYERNLNRALLGRAPIQDAVPAPDVPRQGAQPAPQGDPAVAAAAGQRQAQDDEIHERLGIGMAMWRVAQAFFGLFDPDVDDEGMGDEGDGNGPMQLRFEVVVNGAEEELLEEEDAGEVLEAIVDEAGVDAAPDETAIPPNADDAPALALDPAEVPVVAAAAAPAAVEPAQEEGIAVDNNNAAQQFTLSSLTNATASALMFPAVCAAMGEALRITLPRSWVAKSVQRPGLLQHRWGRSLVGGCVFVVLRDAVHLYSKHRRVQVKKRRKVKNVGRLRNRERATTT